MAIIEEIDGGARRVAIVGFASGQLFDREDRIAALSVFWLSIWVEQ